MVGSIYWCVPVPSTSASKLVERKRTFEIRPGVDFGRFMPKTRFEMILAAFYLSDIRDKAGMAADPWFLVRRLIDSFNENRRQNVNAGWLVALDELMSAWTGQGLPHLSVLPRKPEDKGTEMKCIAGVLNEIMLYLEIMEGKDAMSTKAHVSELGATAAYTLRLTQHGSGFPMFNKSSLFRDFCAEQKPKARSRQDGHACDNIVCR